MCLRSTPEILRAQACVVFRNIRIDGGQGAERLLVRDNCRVDLAVASHTHTHTHETSDGPRSRFR
jgi:hypothetical protein